MKKLNLSTAIYSLVASIILLIAPMFTLGAIVDEAVNESGATTNSQATNYFFIALAVIMLALGIINLVKVKESSTAGKILLIVGGAIIVVFSSLLGFVGGVCGIVGAGLLFASNKKISEV